MPSADSLLIRGHRKKAATAILGHSPDAPYRTRFCRRGGVNPYRSFARYPSDLHVGKLAPSFASSAHQEMRRHDDHHPFWFDAFCNGEMLTGCPGGMLRFGCRCPGTGRQPAGRRSTGGGRTGWTARLPGRPKPVRRPRGVGRLYRRTRPARCRRYGAVRGSGDHARGRHPGPGGSQRPPRLQHRRDQGRRARLHGLPRPRGRHRVVSHLSQRPAQLWRRRAFDNHVHRLPRRPAGAAVQPPRHQDGRRDSQLPHGQPRLLRPQRHVRVVPRDRSRDGRHAPVGRGQVRPREPSHSTRTPSPTTTARST